RQAVTKSREARTGARESDPPDERQVPSRRLALPAVAPELLLLAAGAGGDDEHPADSRTFELETGGGLEVEVGLAVGTGTGHLRRARGHHLSGHVLPHLVAAGADRRSDPGGPLPRIARQLLQGGRDHPARDPPPAGVHG